MQTFPSLATATLVLACVAATAQPARFPIDLPAQPLAISLSQLGQRAGISVLAPQPLVAGRTAPALRGNHTARSALDALLQDSGLQADIEAGVATVRRATPPAAAAPAAATTPPADPQQQLATVLVTAERSIEPAASRSTQILGREELERFPVSSPGDLFKEVPGVTVANSRNGAALDLNIRGMQGFGRVRILVDGTESSASTYKGYGGDTTQSFVDPELLGEIKVEKGPNAGPYGAGVVGGVVSMSTLTADDLITSGRQSGLRVRGTLVNNQSDTSSYAVLGPPASGSSDESDAIVRDLSLPGKAWYGSIAGAWRLLDDRLEIVAARSHRQSGNYVSGSRGDVLSRHVNLVDVIERKSLYQPGQTVYNTSQDTDSTLLKAALRLPHGQKLSLGYSNLQSTFGEARSAAFIEYIEQLNPSSVDSRLYTAQYAWTPDDSPWIDLRLNLWAARSEAYQAADVRTGGGTHRATSTDTRSRGMEAWNTSTLDLPLGDMTLRYGLTWLSEKTEVTPLDGDIYMDPGGDRSLQSAFLQADLQPTNWLLLNAGLRRERYEVHGYGETTSGIPGQILPLRLAHAQSRTNHSLGVTLQPTQALQFFARHSQGWRPPTAKESVNSLIAASNPTRVMLRPESTRSTEAGIQFALQDRWRPQDRFNAGLTFFDTKTDDYVYGSAGEFRNADQAHFRGAEFNLGYDAGVFFSRYGHTRYQRVAFCDSTRPSPDQCTRMPQLFAVDPSFNGYYVPPRSQQSLTVGTRLLDRRLTLGVRMTAAKAYAKDGVLISGWDSYRIYDLFGSWRINKNLDLQFSVENLQDRFYMEASTSTMLAIPSPGRTAKATLTYTF